MNKAVAFNLVNRGDLWLVLTKNPNFDQMLSDIV